MPWRQRPAAASEGWLFGAAALIAVAAALRAPDPPPPASIDTTLTRDSAGCAGVRSTVWHPLSGLDYTGRLRVSLPARFGGAIAMYIGDSIPLDIEVTTIDGEAVAVAMERLQLGPGIQVPPDFWLDDGSPLSAPQHITRLTIDALGTDDRDVIVSLGRRAPRVLARLVNYAPAVSAAVCAVPVNDVYFATGWYGEERDSLNGSIRWMRQHGAVLWPSRDGKAVSVRARLRAAADREVTLNLRVNDVHDAPGVALREGFADYEWKVPDTAWVSGSNELLLTVSRTRAEGTRTLGLALASLNVH